MDTLSLVQFNIPKARFQERPPNNDYFLAYLRYGSKQDNFKKELAQDFGGDLKLMIKAYRQRFPFL